MINRTKQDWSNGSTVKVGFLSLIVKCAVPTPGDFAPDAYILVNKAGTQLYKFVPHNGVEKISAVDARELVADAWARADKVASKAIQDARDSRRAVEEINAIIIS